MLSNEILFFCQFHCMPKSEKFEKYYTFLDSSSRERNVAVELTNMLLYPGEWLGNGLFGSKSNNETTKSDFQIPTHRFRHVILKIVDNK